jgi:ribosomal protein L37E
VKKLFTKRTQFTQQERTNPMARQKEPHKICYCTNCGRMIYDQKSEICPHCNAPNALWLLYQALDWYKKGQCLSWSQEADSLLKQERG